LELLFDLAEVGEGELARVGPFGNDEVDDGVGEDVAGVMIRRRLHACQLLVAFDEVVERGREVGRRGRKDERQGGRKARLERELRTNCKV
jgi:hypothetical protein